MSLVVNEVQVWEGYVYDEVPWERLVAEAHPVVLKGLVRDWPLVEQGNRSAGHAISYLKSFYNNLKIGLYRGSAGINGRYFYNDNFTELNFVTQRVRLDDALDEIAEHLRDEQPPSRYIGSTSLEVCLPGLSESNDLNFDNPVFTHNQALKSIWIGNRSVASTHFDAPHNIACVAVGERRFTVFPPEQVENLYPGPLEPTPGGQVVSLVDLNAPDLKRFPKYSLAAKHGQFAELQAGDAIFIPSMWWHQVEGLSPFNVLLNYWWDAAPKYMGSPMNVLYHAFLSLKDRPASERNAWRELFNYYIFDDPSRAANHLPEAARGFLGEIDESKARKLRAMLLQKLNR